MCISKCLLCILFLVPLGLWVSFKKNFRTLLNLSLIQKPTAVNSCLFCPRSSSRLLVFSIHTLLRSPFTLRLSPFTLRLSNRSAFSTIDRIVHRTDSCAEYFAAEKKSSGRNICFFQKCKRQGAFFDHLGPAFSFNHPGPALSNKWAMIYLILGCPPISPCMALQGGAEGGGGWASGLGAGAVQGRRCVGK